AAGDPPLMLLRAARAAGELVDAYRLHGHRAAKVDPLGTRPPGHPMLQADFHHISDSELEALPAALVEDLTGPGSTMAEALAWLRDTYTGSIGYEYEYLEDPAHREWLRQQIEEGTHRQPLTQEEKRRLLTRLTE